MALEGLFDAEVIGTAWFSPSLSEPGWYEFGMPFDNALISAGGPQTYQVSTTLAKTLALAVIATGVFNHNMPLAKTLAISQTPGVKRYPAMTLAKTLAISQLAGRGQFPAMTLARTMGFSSLNIITKNAALSLAKTLGIGDGATGIFTRGVSLAKTLTISQTPGVQRYPVVTLSKALGFTDSATGVFPRGTSLAKTLSFSNVGGLQRQVTVTFSRNAGYATVNIITKNVAMNLARSMTISQTPGVKRYPVLTMTKTLTFSDIARGTFNHGVTLGKTLVITDVGSLKRLGVLTLARTLALSTVGNINTTKALTLALALQFASDGSTVGIATALVELILGGREFNLELGERGSINPLDGNGSTAVDSGSNGLNGVYQNVTLGGPVNLAWFNGVNSYVDYFSAGLVANYHGDETTIIVRAKVNSSAVWTDGKLRALFSMQPFDPTIGGSGDIYIYKDIANNTIVFFCSFNSGFFGIQSIAFSSLSWFSAGMTFSTSVSEQKNYLDGVQVGVTDSPITPFHSAYPLANSCYWGATTPAGADKWLGWMADGILGWGTVASPAQMFTIHTKLNAGTLTTTDLDTIFGAGNYCWWKLGEASGYSELTLAGRDLGLYLDDRSNSLDLQERDSELVLGGRD